MKKFLMLVVLLCSAILLVGAQDGFAHQKKILSATVEDCFNGVDDDDDGLIDCADADCEGAQDGPCDTGLPGLCATGTLSCVAGDLQCSQTNQPVAEICDDGIDNDCDGLIDAADPECEVPLVENCFNGIDDDEDGLIDCADADCEGVQNGTCDTGLSGICAAGTLTCIAGGLQCSQSNQPVPEVCDDGIDNDCDGLNDAVDPDCSLSQVEDCFNGVDDDGDGLVDCADPDCEGVQNGACETGLPGICAAGTQTCTAGELQCSQINQPVAEICDDDTDNDCDGTVDGADLDCAIIGDKVTICHIPRGNPARAHTIVVDVDSLSNHLAHGDTIGPCDNSTTKHPKKQHPVKSPKKKGRSKGKQ